MNVEINLTPHERDVIKDVLRRLDASLIIPYEGYVKDMKAGFDMTQTEVGLLIINKAGRWIHIKAPDMDLPTDYYYPPIEKTFSREQKIEYLRDSQRKEMVEELLRWLFDRC